LVMVTTTLTPDTHATNMIIMITMVITYILK
jgi:hypothetical protein